MNRHFSFIYEQNSLADTKIIQSYQGYDIYFINFRRYLLYQRTDRSNYNIIHALDLRIRHLVNEQVLQ